jgi:hypothetical protein
MSSSTLPATEGVQTRIDALGQALANVAERSFFAFAETVDRATFDDRAADVAQWQVAVVSFRGGLTGTMTCALPSTLGGRLFDAFTGRGDADPDPSPEMMADLIGELLNMVCGAWLTKLVTETPFVLNQPRFVDVPEGWRPWSSSLPHEFEVTALVDDLPFAIQVHF